MPGDPLKYVQAGQPLTLPAEAWNAFIDTTKRFRAQQQRQGNGETKPPPWPLTITLVENGTEDDLDQFAVLGINAPLIPPADDADTFAEKVRLAGVEPTEDHVGNGKFVILLEPAAAGDVALCCIAGATICKVNIVSEDDEFADAESGTTAELLSGSAGPIQILWKEEGVGSGKWMIGRWGATSKATIDALIAGAVQDGSNKRWVYSFVEAEKTSTGYGGWTTKAGGIDGDCYNRAEEINGATGLMGNGVTLPLVGSFDIQPIPDGTPVRLEIVPVVGDDPEYWFSMPNGIDGSCDDLE
jgi:hypothetical protein